MQPVDFLQQWLERSAPNMEETRHNEPLCCQLSSPGRLIRHQVTIARFRHLPPGKRTSGRSSMPRIPRPRSPRRPGPTRATRWCARSVRPSRTCRPQTDRIRSAPLGGLAPVSCLQGSSPSDGAARPPQLAIHATRPNSTAARKHLESFDAAGPCASSVFNFPAPSSACVCVDNEAIRRAFADFHEALPWRS